jgi:hypothetical protein
MSLIRWARARTKNKSRTEVASYDLPFELLVVRNNLIWDEEFGIAQCFQNRLRFSIAHRCAAGDGYPHQSVEAALVLHGRSFGCFVLPRKASILAVTISGFSRLV